MCFCAGFAAGCCGACAATAVGSCLCACCSCSPPRHVAKFLYGVLFLVTTVVVWVIRDYASPALSHLYSFSSCNADASCISALAVLRLTFGLFLFYFLMLLTTLGPPDDGGCADTWHVRWWPLKVLLWLFLLLIPFLIPSVVFQVYGEIAIVGSAFFLVIQLVSIINFVYVWNDMWLENEAMHIWMVVVSVLCYALSLTGVILMYIFFAPHASCGLNIFFITFLLILILAFSTISFLPTVNAGPLTSGVIALYLVFLCWSSIMSEPLSETCNTRPRQSGYGSWIDILGLCVALFSIVISVYTVGIDSRCVSLKPDPEEMDDSSGEKYSLTFFHTVFALGSMYLAMLFLGWNLNQTPTQWSIDSGWFSVWVKMGLLWVSAFLYIWTLVAPMVLKGRDFS